MCFKAKDNDIKIARANIPCWKRINVHEDDDSMCWSPFFTNQTWDLTKGEVHTARKNVASEPSYFVISTEIDGLRPVDEVLEGRVVNEGFHSYKAEMPGYSDTGGDMKYYDNGKVVTVRRTMVEFYIPKGSEYMENDSEYVSLRLGHRKRMKTKTTQKQTKR